MAYTVSLDTIEEVNEEFENDGLVCVYRIMHLPVVQSSLQLVSKLYHRVRRCNCISRCLCKHVEWTAKSTVSAIHPLTDYLPTTNSLQPIDSFLCAGLDLIEKKLPCIKLSTDEMARYTQEYCHEICYRIQKCPIRCICYILYYGLQALIETVAFSECVKETFDELIRAIAVKKPTKKENRFTRAEYEMIAEALRNCPEHIIKMRREPQSPSSSPISGISVEY